MINEMLDVFSEYSFIGLIVAGCAAATIMIII